MQEWERGQDIPKVVKELYSRKKPFQEILESGLYDAAIVGKNKDTGDGYYLKAAKIVTIAGGELNTILRYSKDQDLVKIMRDEDCFSQFDRISKELSEHYSSQKTIGMFIGLIQQRGLQTATAIVLSENPKIKKERVTIHYPKFLSEMIGQLGSTILSANLLNATPSLDLSVFKPLIDAR